MICGIKYINKIDKLMSNLLILYVYIMYYVPQQLRCRKTSKKKSS